MIFILGISFLILIGQPTADEDEVLHAPPPYLERYPLVEEICAMPPNWRQLNLNRDERAARPYGLPNGPSTHRWVPHP